MQRLLSFWQQNRFCLLILGFCIGMLSGTAQTRAAKPDEQPAAAQVEPLEQLPQRSGPFRKLAPGVLVTIDPDQKAEEDFSRHDIPELLEKRPADHPDWKWAQDVRYAHEVWSLELSFKPIRYVWVDLPTADGKLSRQAVWYLMYRVQNLGDKPRRFVPFFVLESQDAKRFYPDQLIPLALPAIIEREDPNRKLLDSVSIVGEIPPSGEDEEGGVWGVATWTEIDAHTDRFSVYARGLTNASRWEDTEEGRRRFSRKTLRLNFWRPGDEFFEHEGEIRFGMPDELDYRWIYR
jgi:hypothetical protein